MARCSAPLSLVEKATCAEPWDEITRERALHRLIYLALARFDGRPPFSRLSAELQHDFKDFFSSYAQARLEADDLLFSVNDPAVVDGPPPRRRSGSWRRGPLCSRKRRAHLSPLLRIFERGFLPADHPLQAKFARLTRSEVRESLHEDPRRIGTGWPD